MNDNRFETPTADLGSSQTSDMKYAGFWIRVVASIIDTIWQVIVFGGLAWLFFGEALLSDDPFAGGIGMIIFQYILPFIIIVAFWIYYGATPGKMALGLKICRADNGGKATAGQCIGRYFGYLLSMIPMGLGFIWVAFSKRKQGWHDMLAKTVVLKTR
jgi:uncharacterized RDD family membrane protein YckC